MPKTLLVTRPQYDSGTHYLFHFATVYMDLAKNKGHQVLDLDRNRATKKELTSIVNKMKPRLICFNGHGNYGLIAGSNGETLVEMRPFQNGRNGVVVLLGTVSKLSVARGSID